MCHLAHDLNQLLSDPCPFQEPANSSALVAATTPGHYHHQNGHTEMAGQNGIRSEWVFVYRVSHLVMHLV